MDNLDIWSKEVVLRYIEDLKRRQADMASFNSDIDENGNLSKVEYEDSYGLSLPITKDRLKDFYDKCKAHGMSPEDLEEVEAALAGIKTDKLTQYDQAEPYNSGYPQGKGDKDIGEME